MDPLSTIRNLSRRLASSAIRNLHPTAPRDYLVTGIPRSGTSLLSAQLSRSPNSVCFNEIHYDFDTLELFFWRMRRRISKGEPVPNIVDESGRPITSQTDETKHDVRPMEVQAEPPLRLGHKLTISYLRRLSLIAERGYPLVAIVRDPVYTLGSWRRPALEDAPMQELGVEKEEAPHWEEVNFLSEQRLHRQAQAWEHYADLLWTHRRRLLLVTYEQLVTDTEEVLVEICDFLDIGTPEELEPLEDRNDPARYEEMDEIRESVQRYCPSRRRFGYR